MRISLVIGVILISSWFWNCQSEARRMQRDIARVEEILDKTADPERAQQLIEMYKAYADRFPEQDDLNSKYFYRGAGLAYRMNRYSEAIELLHQAIRQHYNSSNTVNNALLLAGIYQEKLRDQKLAQTVYQATARSFPDSGNARDKINAEWPDLDVRLREMSNAVFDTSGRRIDYRMANDFINSATIYAMILPGQEQSAEWLFDAAETARSIRAFGKALDLYAWVCEGFPESTRASQALFLQAFTLDNDLGRYDEARIKYQAFLESYPENEFADDAQFLLENLGKSEEEIIRAFEEKNNLNN
jgi:TolA-binding protein